MSRKVHKDYQGHQPVIDVSDDRSKVGCTCGWKSENSALWLRHFLEVTRDV